FPAADIAATREQATLQEFGLRDNAFAGFGKLALGTRRQNLVYVDDLSAESEADGLRLAFTLPAGSYATVLLRELMKKEIDAKEGPCLLPIQWYPIGSVPGQFPVHANAYGQLRAASGGSEWVGSARRAGCRSFVFGFDRRGYPARQSRSTATIERGHPT